MRVKTCINNNRGIALLVTLSVMVVIIGVALELHRKKRIAVSAGIAARERVTLSHMADSGIHIAMALLLRDKADSETDSIQEDWASPEKCSEVLAEFPFENGSLEVVISDERGRIQINALVALPGHEFNPAQFHLWDRLLILLKTTDETLSELDHMAVINSVKDWIDSGDDDAITGLTGAESSYYESLTPPYACRNNTIDHLDELLLVKGISRELFKGTNDTSDFLDHLSVYGASSTDGAGFTFDGKININTAPLPVLAALLPEDYDGYGPDIISYRTEKSDTQYVNSLTGLTWYKNVAGLEDLTLTPELITNTSDLFRITATAVIGGRKQRVTAIVLRETDKKSGKWRCRILRWQID